VTGHSRHVRSHSQPRDADASFGAVDARGVLGDQLWTSSSPVGPTPLNAKRRTVLDGLPNLLFEANVVLGIQNRASEVGIRVDKTFVQARLARWQEAMDDVQASLRDLEASATAKAGARDWSDTTARRSRTRQ
jgi:hypothetical protein